MSTYGLLVRDPTTKAVLLDSRVDRITRAAGTVTVSPSARVKTITLATDGTLWWSIAPLSAGSSAGTMPSISRSGMTVTVTLPAGTSETVVVTVGVY